MGTGLALLTLLVLALIALAFWRKVELQFEYLQRKESKGKQIARHWLKTQKNGALKELRSVWGIGDTAANKLLEAGVADAAPELLRRLDARLAALGPR